MEIRCWLYVIDYCTIDFCIKIKKNGGIMKKGSEKNITELDIETKQKLEKLGKRLLEDIETDNSPAFEAPLRGGSNVKYDEKQGVLILGDKREKRVFLNVAQAKKFMQTVAVAAKCKKFKEENLHTSIRGLFYQLKFTLGEDIEEELFEEQSESNELVEDLEVALNVKREDLNLSTDRKGVVAGPLVIKDKFGETETVIDCTKQGRSGWMIPSDVDNGMEFVKCDADYVLCLHPSERLLVSINGNPKLMTIKQLMDHTPHGKINDLQIISYDENYNTCMNKILFITKRPAKENEKVIEIISRSGSSICVSENHKIPVLTENGIVIKKACEIKEGDFILEAKRISVPLSQEMRLPGINVKEEYIDLIELLKDTKVSSKARVKGAAKLLDKNTALQLGLKITKKFGKREYTVPYRYLTYGWKDRDSIPLNIYYKLEKDPADRKNMEIFFEGSKKNHAISPIIKLDNSFAKLLGYYLSEGHCYRNVVGFSLNINEKSKINEICGLIKQIFDLTPRLYQHGGEVQIYIQNKAVYTLFKLLNIGSYAHTKRIPDFVYAMNYDFIWNLLDGYLKGDGYVNGPNYRSTTVSKDLHYGLNLLFRMSGVPTYKSILNGKKFGKYISKRAYATDVIKELFFDKNYQEKRRALWNRYPLFLVKDEKKNKLFAPYFFNNYKTINKTRLEKSNDPEVQKWLKADVHPVMVSKVKSKLHNGFFYEVGAVVPSHVFMHASGIFSHNCIEKDALWQRLNEDHFWKKENCIIITPKGQASRGCRRLIRKLADMKLPIYCFMDCDAWGWYIYWTIKTGSMNLAYLGSSIATPEAKFIGVTMKDINNYDFLKKLTIRAKDVDIKRAEEMLSYPWISAHKEWVDELKTVLETKKKLEQDALQGPRLTFVGEYVRDKIKNKDFLP